MKVAAFYENILEGAKASGIPVLQAVRELMGEGLDLLYASVYSARDENSGMPEVIRETGIGVEGLYGFYDFGHHPEDESYRELIDTAAELSAGNVLIIPGFIQDEEKDTYDEQVTNMKAALKRAVSYGKEKGVAVSLEDVDNLNVPVNSIAGLKAFFDDIPGLSYSFDTGNFCMYHEDEMEAFSLFRDKICTVHLKDRSEGPVNEDDRFKFDAEGGKVYPAVTGTGTIRIKEILESLKASGYTGNVIAELYDYSPSRMLTGIKESVAFVRETWGLPLYKVKATKPGEEINQETWYKENSDLLPDFSQEIAMAPEGFRARLEGFMKTHKVTGEAPENG